MNNRNFSSVPLMRRNNEEGEKQLNVLKKIIEDKYRVKIKNYWDFHKWSIKHIEEFWAEVWYFIGIIYSKTFDKVIDLSIPMYELPEWFQGAKLNFAENLLKFRDDRVALVIAGEDRDPETVTFKAMFEEARLYAAAFKKFGLQKGDRVACYMSNRKEAVFAMQATTSIGAIWTGAFPLMGPQAVLNRLKQVSPRILITIDRFRNNGNEHDMLQKIKEITDGLPSLQKVVIVPSKPDSKLKDMSHIRNSCFLDEFLQSGRNPDGSVPNMSFEQVSFSHPVFINYTSGTTGLPKAVIHGSASLMMSSMTLWLQLDCDRNALWYSMSPVGWVSWNMVVSLNFSGMSIFLFEGVPYFLSPTYFWDMVDDFNITHVFLGSSVVDDLEKLGYVPSEACSLKSLKVFIAGGSVVKPASYDFMYKKIKREFFFSATYGCTEIIGTALNGMFSLPIYRGEIAAPPLGLAVECIDENGQPVKGEVGEVVITKPAPCMLSGLWGNSDESLCRKAYFDKFPGKFALGDYAIISPVTNGYVICGRSDDTLKQRGARFGSSDIYNVVDILPEIRDSLCVAQFNKDMEERAVLFLVMKRGHGLTENLIQFIRERIAEELTPSHIPRVIMEIGDIPYNVNGKKMESIVKKIINKRPYNADSVINAECLKLFVDIPELQGF